MVNGAASEHTDHAANHAEEECGIEDELVPIQNLLMVEDRAMVHPASQQLVILMRVR